MTVCPRCKAVYRSGGMECHDTMSSHVMECHEEVVTSQVDSSWGWSMRLIPKNKVSTGNAETMSAMVQIRGHRDSVREGDGEAT